MGQRCLPFAAVLLAAGQSSRMGRPKQLLPYKGQTLLGYSIDQARDAELSPLLVVVGAGGQAVRAAIAAKPVEIVENPYWASGMGSSIAAGMRSLLARQTPKDVGGVAILLGDQPLICARHLAEMLRELSRSSAAVIAAEYNGSVGVPAVFRRSLFGQLATLPPQSGAKALLQDRATTVLRFPLPEAGADVDTPDDWAALGLGLTAEREG